MTETADTPTVLEARSLCREFRRATGSTPAVYRRKTLSQRVAPDPVSDDEACLA